MLLYEGLAKKNIKNWLAEYLQLFPKDRILVGDLMDLLQRRSQDLTLAAIFHNLRKHRRYSFMNYLCQSLVDLGFEAEMSGLEYYCWAAYASSIGQKDVTRARLKIAAERGFKNIEEKDADPEIMKLLGKTEVDKIIHFIYPKYLK
jgi:hypothetical protein